MRRCWVGETFTKGSGQWADNRVLQGFQGRLSPGLANYIVINHNSIGYQKRLNTQSVTLLMYYLLSQDFSSLPRPSNTCSRSCPFANRPYRRSLSPPTVFRISSNSIPDSSSSLLISSSTSSMALSSSGKIEVSVCGFATGRLALCPNNYFDLASFSHVNKV